MMQIVPVGSQARRAAVMARLLAPLAQFARLVGATVPALSSALVWRRRAPGA